MKAFISHRRHSLTTFSLSCARARRQAAIFLVNTRTYLIFTPPTEETKNERSYDRVRPSVRPSRFSLSLSLSLFLPALPSIIQPGHLRRRGAIFQSNSASLRVSSKVYPGGESGHVTASTYYLASFLPSFLPSFLHFA